jgi:hypothetical protein
MSGPGMTIRTTGPGAAPRWRRCATVVIALAALVTSACSGGGSPVFHPTMTEQQAIARAEQILHETAAAISPRPTLEVYQPGSDTGPCLINPNDTSDKRMQVVRTYWLRGITEQDNASVGEQILRFWKHKGYAISDTKGVGTSQPDITGATQIDDFLISLEWSADGSLSIGTTSPCIWPKGTPPPS